MMIMALGGLMACLTPAQAQNFETQQPNSSFQSTSTMKGSGSAYSSNPTLNENGTANSPAPSAAPSGPNRAKKDLGLPGMPNTDGIQGNVPLGDALVPLMLMALGFGVYCAVRGRKERTPSK